eukprot:scaffold219861_cov27-Tisochrysis_lutea.AAC.3
MAVAATANAAGRSTAPVAACGAQPPSAPFPMRASSPYGRCLRLHGVRLSAPSVSQHHQHACSRVDGQCGGRSSDAAHPPADENEAQPHSPVMATAADEVPTAACCDMPANRVISGTMMAPPPRPTCAGGAGRGKSMEL